MHTPPLFLPDSLYSSMLKRQRRACRLQLHAAGGRAKKKRKTRTVAQSVSATTNQIDSRPSLPLSQGHTVCHIFTGLGAPTRFQLKTRRRQRRLRFPPAPKKGSRSPGRGNEAVFFFPWSQILEERKKKKYGGGVRGGGGGGAHSQTISQFHLVTRPPNCFGIQA